MKGRDLLFAVCRSLDVLALPGLFTATLAAETTSRGGAASPVDFHGDVHGRAFRLTFEGVPGEFALTFLAGETRNGLGLVRVSLSSIPSGSRLVAHDFVATGSEEDGEQIAGILYLMLSSVAPVGVGR